MIVFVSTGRTGTAFFKYLFDQCALNAVVEHEPKPDITGISIDYARRKITERAAVSKIQNSRRSMLKFVEKSRKQIYIESNGGFTFSMPILKEVFPNLTIVHIIRNPLDWITSAYNRFQRIDGNKMIPRYSVEVNWKFSANDFVGQEDKIDWKDSSLAEKLAWVWDFKNRFILESIVNDRNAITVRFEDIFNNGEGYKCLGQLLKFLSSRADLDLIDVNLKELLSSKKNSTKTNMTNADVFLKNARILDITRELTLRYYPETLHKTS